MHSDMHFERPTDMHTDAHSDTFYGQTATRADQSTKPEIGAKIAPGDYILLNENRNSVGKIFKIF